MGVKAFMVRREAMQVTLAQMPGPISGYGLDEGATVRTLLSVAGIELSGRQITVNGCRADETTVLHDGDQVSLLKRVKGN